MAQGGQIHASRSSAGDHRGLGTERGFEKCGSYRPQVRSRTSVRLNFQSVLLVLGWRPQGVKAGAAAEHFVEGLAEVAEAGIADFEGGLGDVALPSPKEFGGALEAGAAEPLGDGETGLAGEGAAEVEVAAGDTATEFFKRGRLGEIFQQDGLGPGDALGGEPLGASAKSFGFTGRKEELGREFEGLGFVPEALRGRENGRVQERLEELAVAVGERGHSGEAANRGDAREAAADQRVKVGGVRGEPVLEKGEGEFHAEEFVVLASEALSPEVAAIGDEEGGGIGAEVHAGALGDNPTGALEVETYFDAGGMEAIGPVEVGRGLELVPFEAEAVAGKAAGQLTPKGTGALPERQLAVLWLSLQRD